MVKAKELKNWRIDVVLRNPEDLKSAVRVIGGFVNGERIKDGTLHFFDSDEMVAMTEKQIFSLGDPDVFWMRDVVASGLTIEDFDMKTTTH